MADDHGPDPLVLQMRGERFSRFIGPDHLHGGTLGLQDVCDFHDLSSPPEHRREANSKRRL